MSYFMTVYRKNDAGKFQVLTEVTINDLRQYNGIMRGVSDKSKAMSGKLGGADHMFREMTKSHAIVAESGVRGTHFTMTVYMRPGDWVSFA